MSADPGEAERLDLRGPQAPEDVPALLQRVDEVLLKAGCGGTARMHLLIAIEEAVVNVLFNGWPGDQAQERVFGIGLEHRRHADRLEVTIEIIDDGIAFDPTRAPPPDIDAPIEDRKIGGLGIFFVREMTDTQHYARVADRNWLRLTKSCPIEEDRAGPD